MFSFFTTGDKILILALIGFTFSIFFVLRISQTQSSQRRVFIEVDNRLVERVPLSEITASRQISIALPKGEARLEMEGGRVRMLPMKKEICPRGICSQMGWIGRPGEMIVCMPNKLVVRIEASREEVDQLDMDAVSR
ncbi:MAG: hypothetical protein GTO13_05190 [Proteobacteria bacterium]|nr:hypothetical protein [Pseudomonadota bacterium]